MADHATHEHHEPAHEEVHTTNQTYVRIAIILAIITLVEVVIYYIPTLRAVLVPALIVLSLAKFLMVVGYFMHLKFDDKRLAWIFAGGMILALSIYIGTWAMMHFQQITEFFSNMKAS